LSGDSKLRIEQVVCVPARARDEISLGVQEIRAPEATAHLVHHNSLPLLASAPGGWLFGRGEGEAASGYDSSTDANRFVCVILDVGESMLGAARATPCGRLFSSRHVGVKGHVLLPGTIG
jgi:hypothetical protein